MAGRHAIIATRWRGAQLLGVLPPGADDPTQEQLDGLAEASVRCGIKPTVRVLEVFGPLIYLDDAEPTCEDFGC